MSRDHDRPHVIAALGKASFYGLTNYPQPPGPSPPLKNEEASYVPGSGWVEFDPTNGIVGNRDLIRVGVSRTPRQAVPLSGSYSGDPDDELGMDVSVQVKTESPL
jgi:hypothetical protein